MIRQKQLDGTLISNMDDKDHNFSQLHKTKSEKNKSNISSICDQNKPILKLGTPSKGENIPIHTPYLAFTNLDHFKQKKSIGLFSCTWRAP